MLPQDDHKGLCAPYYASAASYGPVKQPDDMKQELTSLTLVPGSHWNLSVPLTSRCRRVVYHDISQLHTLHAHKD